MSLNSYYELQRGLSTKKFGFKQSLLGGRVAGRTRPSGRKETKPALIIDLRANRHYIHGYIWHTYRALKRKPEEFTKWYR
jgi:hypothetical protein